MAEHQQCLRHGSHALMIGCFDDHWAPFWLVPNGETFTCHTLHHSGIDNSGVDASLHQLAEHLGICVIHRVPNPTHDSGLCGAMAVSFLAHVALGTRLPRDDHMLRNRSWDMKQKFARAIEHQAMPMPEIWGWHANGESRPLPKMPVLLMQ